MAEQKLDVAAMLQDIRAAAEQRRANSETMLPFEPALSDINLRKLLGELEATRVVSTHWPLHGKTVLQRIIVFMNKIVRRYLRWYINPIAEQQNVANDAMVQTFHGVIDTLEEQQALIAHLRARVTQLESSLSERTSQ